MPPMTNPIDEELAATLEARKELGPGHDDHLIAGFLERIDSEIERRVDERLARRSPRQPLGKEELGVAIPLVVVAGIFAGVTGVVAIAVALTVTFLVLTVSRR